MIENKENIINNDDEIKEEVIVDEVALDNSNNKVIVEPKTDDTAKNTEPFSPTSIPLDEIKNTVEEQLSQTASNTSDDETKIAVMNETYDQFIPDKAYLYSDEDNMDSFPIVRSSKSTATSEQPSLSDVRPYNRRTKYTTKRLNASASKFNNHSIIIFVLATLIAIASTCYFVNIFINPSSISSANQTQLAKVGEEDNFGISDEDLELLAAEGYDGEELTKTVDKFMQNFFTFDKASVDDNSWEDSFKEYINSSELVEIQENLIYTRTQTRFKEVFKNHPYYQSKLISNNSIVWRILPTDTVNIPYCDIYSTIDTTPLETYFLNSPALEINRYVNCYRIVFDKDGKIVSIKKLRGYLKEAEVNKSDMDNDYEHMLNATEIERRKAQNLAKDEEAEKAADKARKEAEEAETKRLEEEKAKQEAAANSNTTKDKDKKPGSNINTNTTTNTENDNSNTSSGNSNTTNGDGNNNSTTNSSNTNNNSSTNNNQSYQSKLSVQSVSTEE